MKEPKKPFTLYTYYLIAIVATLFGGAFLSEIAFPNMNDYVFIAMFPLIFIGVLLVGYFKWRRYRKLMGLTGRDTFSYGLGSTTVGLAGGTVKDLVSDTRRKQGELPRYVVAIILALTFAVFVFVIQYFGS